MILQPTEARKPGLRGERVISRKAIVQGMPDCSAYLWFLTRVLFSLHTRPPVRKTPGIPCALRFPRGMNLASLGRILPRECEGVCGRHCDRKRSNPELLRQPWIASAFAQGALRRTPARRSSRSGRRRVVASAQNCFAILSRGSSQRQRGCCLKFGSEARRGPTLRALNVPHSRSSCPRSSQARP
jgi:hypothetical protein